jgi:hypothetical protein
MTPTDVNKFWSCYGLSGSIGADPGNTLHFKIDFEQCSRLLLMPVRKPDDISERFYQCFLTPYVVCDIHGGVYLGLVFRSVSGTSIFMHNDIIISERSGCGGVNASIWRVKMKCMCEEEKKKFD